jgi:hypothetical protein
MQSKDSIKDNKKLENDSNNHEKEQTDQATSEQDKNHGGEKTESSKEQKTPREQLRFNPNFKPIETLSIEFAFHQFLCINDSLSKLEGPLFEPIDWKDPKIIEKLEEKIKMYNARAETWNEWVFNKFIFNIHPETMGMYVQFLKTDDYIWQLLNRQFLIYKTISGVISDQTIQDVISGKITFNKSNE